MRFLYTLLLAVVLPVAASASTISFEFTAVLKSQTVYSGGSTSPIDAPPLTGAFSGLPVGESLNGLAHLTYEPKKAGDRSRFCGACVDPVPSAVWIVVSAEKPFSTIRSEPQASSIRSRVVLL